MVAGDPYFENAAGAIFVFENNSSNIWEPSAANSLDSLGMALSGDGSGALPVHHIPGCCCVSIVGPIRRKPSNTGILVLSDAVGQSK